MVWPSRRNQSTHRLTLPARVFAAGNQQQTPFLASHLFGNHQKSVVMAGITKAANAALLETLVFKICACYFSTR